MHYFVHPTAVVEPGVQIGPRTKIWHFCHLRRGAVIGAECVLGKGVFVDVGVHIGNRCKIQNHVSLYDGVYCEDEVFIGPSAVFTNVKNPRAFISRRGAFQRTLLRKGCTIGANATIICGIEIGSYAFVGAGAVVTRSVPAFALVVGAPARQIGWVSHAGLRLHFDEQGRATCPESGQMYEKTPQGLRCV